MNIRRAEPSWELTYLYLPGVQGSNYEGVLRREARYQHIFAAAEDGHILGRQALDKGWLNWMADLHFRLLGGQTGLIVNGLGAACLLVLCLTGIVIWWPGVNTWKRALTVDFRRRWIRINFDLHSALGFWTLAWVMMWGVSGIYLVWPEHFVAIVNKVSQTTNALPPKFPLAATRAETISLDQIVMRAQRTQPGGVLQSVAFPDVNQPWAIGMAGKKIDDFSHATYLYFDPQSGKQLGRWQVDGNRSPGDWFVWLQEPVHFGIYWGLAAKLLWALLGLSMPVLAVTGVLMYWNRYLRKKWLQVAVNAAPRQELITQ